MTIILEKDFLAGAVLVEVVRQHPEISLSPAFVDAVLSAANDISSLFVLEADPVPKMYCRKIA